MHKNYSISVAELHLFQLLMTGASNKDMALALCKSEFTIRNQLSRLFRKIEVNNRAQAAVWFRDYLAHNQNQRFTGLAERRNSTRPDRRSGIDNNLCKPPAALEQN